MTRHDDGRSQAWPDDSPDALRLLLRAQAGERAALDELVRRYRPPLLALVQRLMSRRLLLRVEAEDIVQDVFVEATHNIGKVSDARRLPAWLKALARHAILDQVRFFGRDCRDSERCVSLDPSDADTTRPPEPAARSSTPSSLVSRSELRHRLDAEIERLPPAYRDVIRLRDIEELDWEAIRDALQRSTVKAVQVLYRRARVMLVLALGRAG